MIRTLVVLTALGMALASIWPASDRERAADGIAKSAWTYVATHQADAAPLAPPVATGPAVLSAPGVIYTGGQLEQALGAQGVGRPGSHIGAAVALAESGGQSDAVCDSCAGVRELSVGPWQINLLAWPAVSQACAMALECAAAAAAAISRGGRDWSPWTMYRNGRWRQFA